MEKYQLKSKDKTRRLVLHYVASQSEFSASDTARALKKTLPTINSCFDYFSRKKFIKKIGVKQGGVGRKSQLWAPIITDRFTMGVEILPHQIRAAIHNLKGEVFYKYTCPYGGGSQLQDAFEKMVEDFSKTLPKGTWDSIKEIGVAVSGVVDFKRKSIIYSSNIGVENLDFRHIEENIKRPIFVENNANAGALGEYFLKDELMTMIYVSITSQGAGGGVFMEGKLQKGSTRRGGEIGHMSIDINGISCPCGNKGCWERYICEQGFLTIAKKHGLVCTSPEEVFAHPQKKDVLAEYVFYLARGLRNLLFIFDPSHIILGGFVSRYWDCFEDLIKKELYKNNPLFTGNRVLHIRGAQFMGDSALIGAGLLPYYRFFYDDEIFN